MHGKDILFFKNGNEFRTVLASGDCFFCFVGVHCSVGVRKIKVRVGVEALQQARASLGLELIPAHVRKFHRSWESANISREYSEAAELGSFITGLVERLQSEANTEKRNAAGDGLEQRSSEATLVKRTHQGGKMSDAWKQERFGVGDAFRNARANRFRAETLERALDRGGVAGTVVDERDFHKRPLVLGKTLRRRLSRETAKRRARAKALKSAAAEWKKGEQAPVMYRTNLRDVPKVDGLKRDDGWVDRAIDRLRQAGHLYEQDGALWFRSTAFGDDKDRVVIRSNGSLTRSSGSSTGRSADRRRRPGSLPAVRQGAATRSVTTKIERHR